MKKIILFVLLSLGSIWLFSCKSDKEVKSYKVWNGIDFNDINKIPVTSVWIKTRFAGKSWFPFKSFDSIDELREIMHCLSEPEQKRDGQPFMSDETLVLYFSPPHEPVLIKFSIDEWSREFEFASGFSRKLYKLLMEKEQCANYVGMGKGEFPSGLPSHSFNIPVDALWVVKDTECKWVPYKSFNSPEELMLLRIHFNDPEDKDFTPDFKGEQNLVVFYLPPYDPIWVSFSIDDSTKEIITKKGRSKQLYKLFNEKQPRANF